MTRDNILFLNTSASYSLRFCIVVQLLFDLFFLSVDRSSDRNFQTFLGEVNVVIIMLMIVFLLIDLCTPYSARRLRSKRIDVVSFFSWLVIVSALVIFALRTCGDC